MREIKFRAWDKKTKKMRAVKSIIFHYEEECFHFDNSRLPKVVNLWGKDIIEDKAIVLHREIKDVELMRYTSLKDKNGKEIYEGDIIRCWSEGVQAEGKVQQRIDGLWIIYPAYQKHIMWGLCPNNNGDTTVEIIGNIFDNPELLEGCAE